MIPGTSIATIGLILLIVAHSQMTKRWKEEDCCQAQYGHSTSASCTKPKVYNEISLGINCESNCKMSLFSDSWAHDVSVFADGDCCYAIKSTKQGTETLIFGIVAFVVVLMTFLFVEFSEKICACECGTNSAGCIICFVNGIGIILVGAMLEILVQPSEAADDCELETVEVILGVGPMIFAATACLGVGVLASMCVTFIICCCDDGKSQERDVPLVPVYMRNENNAV